MRAIPYLCSDELKIAQHEACFAGQLSTTELLNLRSLDFRCLPISMQNLCAEVANSYRLQEESSRRASHPGLKVCSETSCLEASALDIGRRLWVLLFGYLVAGVWDVLQEFPLLVKGYFRSPRPYADYNTTLLCFCSMKAC